MGVVKTYPLRVAAKAAQAPQRKQGRWIDTNVVPLRANDHKASGSGNRCGLSRARILQIAITEVLLKSGVSLSSAAKGAFEFSDRGKAGRGAGQLFPRGKTILNLSPAGPVVSNIDFDGRVLDLMNDAVVIAVDLNAIVARVDSILDNQPKDK